MLPCPPAINSPLCALKSSQSIIRAISARAQSGVKPGSLAKGFTSSIASNQTRKDRNAPGTVTSEALTLLHKTSKLVPRVLETGRVSSGITRVTETSKTWESILSGAHEDLSCTSERPAKIAVYGLGEWSGAAELVTALLADPLASAEQNEAFETRWKDRSTPALTITHGNKLNTGPSSFEIPSSYLTQFPTSVEITEFRSPPISADDNASDLLSRILQSPTTWEADIAIIVCNPLTVSLDTLFAAHLPSNAIIVLSANIPLADLEAIIQDRTAQNSKSQTHINDLPQIICVDPLRGLDAVRALQLEPSSFSAIQRYQSGFVGSRLASIASALHSRLKMHPDIPSVRTNLALTHIYDALRYARDTVCQMRHDSDRAFVDASRLKETVQEAQTRAAIDVFVRRDPVTGKIVLHEVEEATKVAEKEMRIVMDRLTWWRMIWRIDEISGIVSSALRQSWCHGLEKKLIMQTGQLSVLQTNLTKSAFALLATHPTLSTAVLRNTLLQLKGSPNFLLTPESLTQPLVVRRNQMIEYPTMRLHATGQRAVIGMTGGVISGVGVSWAGWLGWMTGSGEGLLGLISIDAGTAMGLGLLTAVASVRWAIGSWEKSKKRWWQDWTRATDGLDRDLKGTLRKVMRHQVVIVADSASIELEKLVNARESQLADISSEIGRLQATLDDVARGGRETS